MNTGEKEKQILLNGFILINFSASASSDSEECDKIIKFFPEETEKSIFFIIKILFDFYFKIAFDLIFFNFLVTEIYDKIDMNNRLNPEEEFGGL